MEIQRLDLEKTYKIFGELGFSNKTMIQEIYEGRRSLADLTIFFMNSILHVAVQKKKEKHILEYLFNFKYDLNVVNHNKRTPVFHAMNEKYPLECLKYLVEMKSDLNNKEIYNSSPVHCFIENEKQTDMEKFEFLLQNSNVNILNGNNYNHLHLTCNLEDTQTTMKMIEKLIEYKCDLNHQGDSGYTPIFFACKNEKLSLEIIQYLIEKKSDLNLLDNTGNSVFHILSLNANCTKELLEYFLQTGVEVNSKGNLGRTALHNLVCSESPSIEIFKMLLEKKADINSVDNEKNTPLHLLTTNKYYNPETVKFFVDNKANLELVSSSDYTPVYSACTNENFSLEVIKFLIQNKCSFNNNQEDSYLPSPLHIITQELDVSLETIKYFVENKCSLSETNRKGNTPLHLVLLNEKISSNNVFEITKYIIESKVSPNEQGENDWSALHIASSSSALSFELVKYLLEQKSNINLSDKEKYTPFHYILSNKNLNFDIVRYFISNKANLELKNKNLNGPLHIISMNPSISSDVVELLVQHKCDVNSKNKYSFLPLHLLLSMFPPPSTEVFFSIFNQKCDLKFKHPSRGQFLDLAFANNQLPFKVFEHLYKRYLKYNEFSNDLVCQALRNNQKKEVLELLFTYADPGHLSAFQNNFLHVYFSSNTQSPFYTEIIEFLVEKKVDLDHLNQYEDTPLSTALNNSNISVEAVRCLVELKCDYNIKGNKENSILHLATKEKISLPVLKYLLSLDLDVNLRNDEGRTPIYGYCYKYYAFPYAQLFLEKRADLNLDYSQFQGDYSYFSAIHSSMNAENKEKLFLIALCSGMDHSGLKYTSDSPIFQSFCGGLLWHRQLYSIYPQIIRDKIFLFLLCLKQFTKNFKVIFPKPIVSIVELFFINLLYNDII